MTHFSSSRSGGCRKVQQNAQTYSNSTSEGENVNFVYYSIILSELTMRHRSSRNNAEEAHCTKTHPWMNSCIRCNCVNSQLVTPPSGHTTTQVPLHRQTPMSDSIDACKPALVRRGPSKIEPNCGHLVNGIGFGFSTQALRCRHGKFRV